MPFDPTKPTEGAPLDAAVIRAQLVALNDAIAAGVPGPQGPQGPTGEISQQDLVNERMNHAQNPTGVADLSLIVSDPPTQTEMQAIVSKLNELMGALRRQP